MPNPNYSQDFNRYSYCRNNPLIYTDPDGEWVHLLVGAIIGGTVNLIVNWKNIEKPWQGFAYFGIGAAAGALGAGVGAGISSSLAGGAFGAGFMGSAGAMTATTSFTSGALIGLGSGFSSGFTTGFGNGLMGGQNFGQALGSGLKVGAIGGLSAGLIGGIAGGIDAAINDRNFWTGKIKGIGGENDPIWGTISLKSSIEPGGDLSSNIDAGHAWIELTGPDGTTTSWGTWGYPDATDPTLTALRQNYQYDLGRSAEVTKSVQITHAQKARFDAYISKPRANNWGILKNCSHFASKSFNYTTGLNVSAHPFMFFTPTPAWLVRTLILK